MPNIRIDISESIATLTIDRPAVKNALDRDTVGECHRALDALEPNAEAGVLIITGAGESSFVSGADINDLRRRPCGHQLVALCTNRAVSTPDDRGRQWLCPWRRLRTRARL
jgi:enoyl-CoA hydratase/carnithine racemase